MEIPLTHKLPFRLDKGVVCVPPHMLHRVCAEGMQPDGFVVLGAGRTGLDTVTWLMQRGVPPSKVKWVMPSNAAVIVAMRVRVGCALNVWRLVLWLALGAHATAEFHESTHDRGTAGPRLLIFIAATEIALVACEGRATGLFVEPVPGALDLDGTHIRQASQAWAATMNCGLRSQAAVAWQPIRTCKERGIYGNFPAGCARLAVVAENGAMPHTRTEESS